MAQALDAKAHEVASLGGAVQGCLHLDEDAGFGPALVGIAVECRGALCQRFDEQQRLQVTALEARVVGCQAEDEFSGVAGHGDQLVDETKGWLMR